MMESNEFDRELQLKLYLRKDDSYSIWDHPNFKSSMVLPEDYKPLSNLMSVLERMNQWSSNVLEKRMTLLKVIGDAMCANENQLRRYMKTIMSPSETSRFIEALRKEGFVERHRARLDFDENEEAKPAAPITLGPAGYLLMKHYYAEVAFARPESWQNKAYSVQRTVALNELRCVAAEQKALKGWRWYANVGNSSKYPSPAAVMQLKTINEDIVDFLIIRAQSSQDFLPFMQKILECYRYLYNRDGRIVVAGTNNENYQIVLLSVSTVKLAKYIAQQLDLSKYPFEVWFVIDEDFDSSEDIDKINKSFYSISNNDIERLELEF